MKTFEFDLVLGGVSEVTEEVANALFEAGCDDGTPHSCDGVAYVAFDRDADSLESAIRSAVANVESAGYTVARIQIDRNDLPAETELAGAS